MQKPQRFESESATRRSKTPSPQEDLASRRYKRKTSKPIFYSPLVVGVAEHQFHPLRLKMGRETRIKICMHRLNQNSSWQGWFCRPMTGEKQTAFRMKWMRRHYKIHQEKIEWHKRQAERNWNTVGPNWMRLSMRRWKPASKTLNKTVDKTVDKTVKRWVYKKCVEKVAAWTRDSSLGWYRVKKILRIEFWRQGKWNFMKLAHFLNFLFTIQLAKTHRAQLRSFVSLSVRMR